MIKNSSLIKAGIGYTIGNVVLKGINFLTIPLFTYFMSTYDYGKFNVYLSYESILFIFVGFALHTSIKNARYDFKEDYNNYLANCIYLMCISFLVFMLLSKIFDSLVIKVLNINSNILNCLIIHSFCTAIITFYLDKISLDYDYKKYILLSFINTFFNISLSLVFILLVTKNSSYTGRVYGSVFSSIITAVLIIIILLYKKTAKLNFNYWRYALTISLPIIPHGISQIILSSFDRIMINKMIGASEAGIYSMSYTIGTILQVLFMSIEKIWTPWFFEKMTIKDIDNIKKRATFLLALTSFIACSIILFSPEIICILTPKSYWLGRTNVMIVLLGTYFSLIYTFPANIEYFYKKTGYIAFATIIAAILNIILNALFIPLYGYTAASYTTLFTYFVYFIFHIFFSRKLTEQCLFDKKKWTIIIIITCCITFISKKIVDYFVLRILIFSGLSVIFFILYGIKKLCRTKS